jgi:Xaa-Pro aminopeptidase
MVSAEKLISDFRSRRVTSELAVFGEAGRISHELAERALSNEVITPGKTRLADVAWWLEEQLFSRNLKASFGLPSIYITGPDGIEAISNERIIRRGDLLMIDWGVGLMNMYTDMKRIAYVLEEGETSAPAGIQNAFEQGLKAREILRKNIKPGKTAAETLEILKQKVEEGGFAIMKVFNQPTDTDKTEIMIGCHSVGNWGHGIGPSIAFFNPERLTYVLHPTNLLAIELFAYTAAPEWGEKKVRIPIEDDGVVTAEGIEWLYPINTKILLVR